MDVSEKNGKHYLNPVPLSISIVMYVITFFTVSCLLFFMLISLLTKGGTGEWVISDSYLNYYYVK